MTPQHALEVFADRPPCLIDISKEEPKSEFGFLRTPIGELTGLKVFMRPTENLTEDAADLALFQGLLYADCCCEYNKFENAAKDERVTAAALQFMLDLEIHILGVKMREKKLIDLKGLKNLVNIIFDAAHSKVCDDKHCCHKTIQKN